MRILPLVLAAALAAPAIGFPQQAGGPIQVAGTDPVPKVSTDKPRSFEDANEPTASPSGANPTPTIIGIGVAGVGVIAVAAGLGGGSRGGGTATATATATATQ